MIFLLILTLIERIDYMDINIRDYIVNNFKNITPEDIKESIEDSIKKGDELTLPGLGVLFEIIWNASNDDDKNNIINKLHTYFQ
jgi:small acid-soluble spore protein I (minor)